MRVDFLLDLGSGVGHVDARVGVRGRHLRVGTLKGRDELGMEERGLLELEPGGDLTRRAEVLQRKEGLGIVSGMREMTKRSSDAQGPGQ